MDGATAGDAAAVSAIYVYHRRVAYELSELAIFLLAALQDVELLGVGEFAVVECVLDLRPDLHHRTEFRLLDLFGDLLLTETVQHRLLHQRHLLH